ncbi:hypothetical protein HN385_03540 [archaeon]|jgi:16S rRNA (guanine(1405)-N(7))-methyltransferase|nr:hypothetical protein [archaeon]MBT3451204.1 hypothetical protein [archaeon]MBT6869770.1 hypothetical protein [archaeon]MBT7192725.1 hypothetical protein [archaeon]MBT7380750.1 hypothetical protein [archaeon]
MYVDGKTLDEERIGQILNSIIVKKELQDIDKEFVRDQLFEFLKRDKGGVKYLSSRNKEINPKCKDYKLIVKSVRARLRKYHSMFRNETKDKEREHLIDQLENEKVDDWKNTELIINNIMKTHASTNERLDFYSSLYQKIFKITGKPDSIIDLGAGLNPLSIINMNILDNRRTKGLIYYAYDLNESEIDQLNKCFVKINNQFPYFKGQAKVFNLLNWHEIETLPAFDICFLLKMSDVLEQGKGHKVTEEIIVNVPAEFVVLSFPTLTISGKKMNYPKRNWVKLMCNRLNYIFEIILEKNEIFYVIRK